MPRSPDQSPFRAAIYTRSLAAARDQLLETVGAMLDHPLVIAR
ncbi:MAG: hypothetical protein U0133_15290 [Gemmatimonadales bacterium]